MLPGIRALRCDTTRKNLKLIRSAKNPSTFNNVSAYTPEDLGGRVVISFEIVPEDKCSARQLAYSFRPDNCITTRKALSKSSFGIREREYRHQNGRDADSKCGERQRQKDYEPQKWVTLVLCKPISRLSEFFSRGQCQASAIKHEDTHNLATQ